MLEPHLGNMLYVSLIHGYLILFYTVHSEATDFAYPPNISGFRMMFLSF